MCVWHSFQLARNHKPIFRIQDEPPRWHLILMNSCVSSLFPNRTIWTWMTTTKLKADEPFFDTRDSTRSSSTSPDASVRGGARSSDFDTEEDTMGPDTPGQTPRTMFEVGKGGLPEVFDDKHRKENVDVGDQDDDQDDVDDDDWVDPSVPTPPPPTKIQAPAMVQTHSNSSSSSGGGIKVKSSQKSKAQICLCRACSKDPS